jgi:hypothetical protein
VKKLFFIIGASIRSALRWAGQHIYTWLFLTPTVLGLSYLSVEKLAASLSTDDLTFVQTSLIGAGLYVGLIALGMSRATIELYHLRRPEYYFESLPIDAGVHLHAALLTRCMRNLIVVAVLLLVKRLMHGNLNGQTVLLLLLFAVLVTTAQVVAALVWIHWGHIKDKLRTFISLLIIISSSYEAGRAFAMAIKGGDASLITFNRTVTGVATAISLLYIFTLFMHKQWRAGDMEYARRLKATRPFRFINSAALRRRFNASIAAQLARDFQLTFRGFASAVYVVVAITLLLLVGLLTVLTTNILPPVQIQLGWGDAMQTPQVAAVKIACALLVTMVSILTPLLVAYEIPLLWLERATGTNGFEVWQAKLLYTRLISLPAPFLAFLVGLSSGKLPLFYSPLLFLECLMLWWSVSSLIGALAFEMPTRTALSIILMLVIGTAVGIGASLGFLTNALLPFGLMIYAQVMHGLTNRGRARARYFLMFGDD